MPDHAILHVVEAAEGDCLVLDADIAGASGTVLIDGGPAGVYRRRLAPVLDGLHARGRATCRALLPTEQRLLVSALGFLPLAERLPLALVTKRLSVRFLDAYWQDLRARRGLLLLHGAGTMRSALGALSDGKVVATMIDQAPRRGLVFPFLGQDALHDTTPAVLAHRAGRPLVVALGRRDEQGEHVLDVPLVLPPDGSARTFVPHATRLASDALGDLVRAHPEQWLWLHRRWKGFERAAPP